MLRNMLRLRLKATDMQIVADTLSRMAKEYKPDELVTVNDWKNPYKAKIEHISLSEWRPSPQAIWQWAIAHGFSVPIENEPFFIPDDILKAMREEGRKWTVEISSRPIDQPWVGTVGSMGSGIYLRPIAHTEYPLLLEIGPSLTGTDRQFIKSVIDECKMLWDAEPLPGQSVDTKPHSEKRKEKAGRPGLDREDYIYRIEKALEAIELRSTNPDMTWKEIARTINWRYGWDKKGVKQLELARLSLLPRADKDLLEEAEARRKEKKKM